MARIFTRSMAPLTFCKGALSQSLLIKDLEPIAEQGGLAKIDKKWAGITLRDADDGQLWLFFVCTPVLKNCW